MLHKFISENIDVIIQRTRATVASRRVPLPTQIELSHGVPLFLHEFLERLRHQEESGAAQIGASASLHGGELLEAGFTIGQVVHGYGDVCQAITGLMVELGTKIATEDFKTLNLCLDIAIAESVTEYARQREHAILKEERASLGLLAHELRNFLNSAALAFEALCSGSVGIGGSTGRILGNSIAGMSDLVTRSLAEVRLEQGPPRAERVLVAELLGEVAITATMQARRRGVKLGIAVCDSALAMEGDAQLITSIITNLVQNACKFTHANGRVTVSTRATANRVAIDVADECGGLPPGKLEHLFESHDQRGTDRSGLGLGLVISLKSAQAIGAQLTARDIPGTGCVFTLDLLRSIRA